jgi:hypothetical protein
MRYSYKTPSINLDIQGINIPKLSSGDDTTVNIAIGEGSFEVEGSATELIEFGVTVMSEVKSFSIWLVDFLADIEARNTASSPDKDDEPADK